MWESLRTSTHKYYVPNSICNILTWSDSMVISIPLILNITVGLEPEIFRV